MLSDRIGRRPVLLTISLLSLVSSYPLLAWLAGDVTILKLLMVEMVFSFYFGIYNGAMVVALSEIVPPHVRATCFSMAYSLAVALFGTFTPFAATELIKHTGNRASPGYWLMAAAALAALGTLLAYRRRMSAAVPAE